MKFGKFESAKTKPSDEDMERKIFAYLEDEKKIIFETKEDVEKDTPRQIKGSYYLTKIAHLILPENIPDIYQAGENGAQTVDRELISLTPGHTLLQEAREKSEDEEEVARKQIREEVGGTEIQKVITAIGDIGLGLNINEGVENYTQDESGKIYYLETFKPWYSDPSNPKQFEALFNEEEIREAIENISDEKIKEKGIKHLERLLILLKEEKQELQERYEANLEKSDPYIEKLEALLVSSMNEELLERLNAITTEKEARNNEDRRLASDSLKTIRLQLKFLGKQTDITSEEYERLDKEHKKLSRAIGIINRGSVDHTR